MNTTITKSLQGRNLLTLKDFSMDEIHYLLQLSANLKSKKKRCEVGRALSGKSIVQIFEKQSTRTRCAFELALADEGGHSTVLTNSHLGSKESIEDSAKVLSRFYHGIMFRGSSHSTLQELARFSTVPVWNGLTDSFHPTQAIATVLTIQEQCKKPLKDIRLVFVGDALSNVAQSLMIISAKLGLQFSALAPMEFFPNTKLCAEMEMEAKKSGASIIVSHRSEKVLPGADVVYTDVWVSMGQEAEIEERIALLSPYRVTMDMLKLSGNNDIIFLHCLPAFHDTKTEIAKMVERDFALTEMEVSDEVFRSSYSHVFDEAENRLHTIKAVVLATIGRP